MQMIFGFNRQDLRLAHNLFKMNVRDRYLGSTLGSFWAIANPFFLMAVYTFVFGFIFKVRLPGAETTLGYVIWLISGYGPWMATAEAVVLATSSVVGAAGIVKNMAFKTELLPIAASLTGTISLVVSLTFLLLLMLVSNNPPSWHIVVLPMIVGLHFFLIAAVGLWLSAINVFIRDLAQAIPNLLTILIFMTPIFYAIDSMPVIVQRLSFINPLYQISEAYRSVLIGGRFPDALGTAYLILMSGLLFSTGLRAFRRVKGRFDSVL